MNKIKKICTEKHSGIVMQVDLICNVGLLYVCSDGRWLNQLMEKKKNWSLITNMMMHYDDETHIKRNQCKDSLITKYNKIIISGCRL